MTKVSSHLAPLIQRQGEPLLHDIFENSAMSFPNELAVDDTERGISWTYGELRQKAIYLRHLLRALGVEGEDYVGVLLPRGGDFYWCMLAILKAGGAYLSLDPDYPAERIKATIEDSKSKMVVTEDNLLHMAESFGGCVPPSDIDTLEALLSWKNSLPEGSVKVVGKSLWSTIKIVSPSMILPPVVLSAASPAYAIFTSGSTGRPKGVCIEHRSAVNFVLGEQRSFPTSVSDRVLQGFSTSFDASVEEIWLAFASGATLVVGTKTTMRSGPALGKVLAEMGITVLSTVPTVLRMVEEIPQPPLLRIVITGGEACPPEVVEKWSHSERQLLNTYGPTEASVVATYSTLLPNQPVTIGRPLPGYSAHIISEAGGVCATGVAGELWLGGISVARGYINREDLNGEKFVPDTFGPPGSNWSALRRLFTKKFLRRDYVDAILNEDNVSVGAETLAEIDEPSSPTEPQRLYRTGDLVRWSQEGEIEFLGRIDSQVKIRGFRVELSEIESAISRYSVVSNICVIVRNDCAGKNGKAAPQTLVCYIEPKAGTSADELTPDVIRDHAASILPDYMVPQRYAILEHIKLSPSGKVDRKTLEQMSPPSADCAPGGNRTEDIVQFETGLERMLGKMWCDVLGIDIVGATDDFFKMGGTSLSAAQFISALRKVISMVPTSVSDLYSKKNIRDLASLIEQQCVDSAVEVPQFEDAEGNAVEQEVNADDQQIDLPEKKTEWRFIAVWTCQAIFLLCLCSLYAAWAGAGIYLTYQTLLQYPLWYIMLTFPVFAYASLIAYIIVACFLKYLILGKVQEGEHEIWGWYYLRWWIVEKIGMPFGLFSGTPLSTFVMRFLGCKIGKNVHLASNLITGMDLLTIQENTVINVGTKISCSEVEGGKLKLQKVNIGAGCITGFRATVKCGSVMENNSELGDLAVLMTNQVVNSNEKWIGAPARLQDLESGNGSAVEIPQSDVDVTAEHVYVSIPKQVIFTTAYFAIWYLLSIILLGPMTYGLYFVLNYGFLQAALYVPVFATGGLFGMLAFTVIFKWLTVGRISECDSPLYSFFYLRWLVNYNLQQLTTVISHQFYSTMFTRTYFNLLGAKLGRRVEISDAREWTPDMLEIEEDCFVADFVGLGGWRVGKGRKISLKKVKVGKKTFLGNSAVIPGGTTIAADSLLGVYTLAPTNSTDGCSYLGSPPFALANRAVVKNSGDRLTFKPPVYLYPARAGFELFRTIAPPMLSTYAFLLCWYVATVFQGLFGLYAIAFAPVVYLVFGLTCALIALIAKYVLVGKYGSQHAPLWSTFVWRAELSTALEEDLAFTAFINLLVGTPFVNCWFRMLGAKIGARVYLASPHLTEPDLIKIGDDSCINPEVTLQGHLFEDRVMKMGPIEIGRQCTIGTRAIVLYHTKMGDGCTLSATSLMMKGEEFPAKAVFGGIPAAPLRIKKQEKEDKCVSVSTASTRAGSILSVEHDADACSV
eukprot:TRINITY_DN1950_c1_g1_i1.p1 TRINITY_DN1950_c1_g1~~TRINITY_DN1950_c1_g1_i1.p1  ORF type:complete len:1506 (-),score=208.91 TRINITY_DN1950_c1_g1_i1:221-4609(-)